MYYLIEIKTSFVIVSDDPYEEVLDWAICLGINPEDIGEGCKYDIVKSVIEGPG